MQRIHVKDDVAIDAEGYLLDDEGNRKGLYKPRKRLDLRELNIIQTYFWYNDLRGRLKQELSPPGYYKGRPRIYVKEDIEQLPPTDSNTHLITSHLRVYYGDKLLAETDKTIPEFKNGIMAFGKHHYGDDEDLRFQTRTTVNFLLNDGGWKLYKIDDDTKFRKQKRKPVKSQRPKKVIKKICKCKRK
jgi:hypothetical protein